MSIRSPNYVDSKEEKRIHKLEYQDEHGAPYNRANKHFGKPHCPFCGRVLKTDKSRSKDLVFKVACSANHWFELSFESGFQVFRELPKPKVGG